MLSSVVRCSRSTRGQRFEHRGGETHEVVGGKAPQCILTVVMELGSTVVPQENVRHAAAGLWE